ncbi:MAG: alpha/beta hydrolase [Planctomycetota bacterium]|jgi:enterochelin esterase-like enzyme
MSEQREQGRIVVHRHVSRVLESNPLGDPVERNLHVYLPPGYDESHAYPTLLAVVGFTGTGIGLFNRDPLAESLDQRLDRLIGEGTCPPVIVVAPDCFTRLGGNQYINSTATGPYEDYLLTEIVPFVRDRHACGRWGVFGKSSGGYGSIVLGMRHPDTFEALADHSGDSNFELCYVPDASAALDAFREAGGPAAWLESFWSDENRRRRKHMKPLNFLAMAAHYSPNPDSPHLGIDLPFDLETGAFRPEVWERWRAWDPVNMVAEHAEGLARMRLVYVDCGTKDEFTLHWGARALVAALRSHGVEPHFEEFDDGHMSINYRYDVSLPLLARALSA